MTYEIGPSAGLFGEVGERPLHVGMLGCERWEQHIADAHTCVVQIRIRRISDHIGNPQVRQIGLHVGARRVQQGANHRVFTHRLDAREPTQTGASKEAKQHGLGLVILRMTHSDRLALAGLRVVVERRIAGITRLTLLGCAGLHLHTQGGARDVQPR